jgi:ribosomal protein S14
MLKIYSKNEKLRQQLAEKEIIQTLRQILTPFFSRTPTLHIQRYLLNLQQKLLFFSSLTKTRSICILTGRSRSVYRSFRLSRIKLREYANAGYFTGLSKASW